MRRLVPGRARKRERRKSKCRRASRLVGGLEKIALQVVTDRDQVPTGRLNFKIRLFRGRRRWASIFKPRSTARPRKISIASEEPIHGGDVPATFGEPQRVAARAAGKIERRARRQRDCGSINSGVGGDSKSDAACSRRR